MGRPTSGIRLRSPGSRTCDGTTQVVKMSDYRSECTTWTSGFGATYNVLSVQCDDEEFAKLTIADDGSCERFIVQAPVYMRTERSYPDVETATASMIQAHR